MSPIEPRRKGQVIDLTEYATGRLNRRSRKPLGRWITRGLLALCVVTLIGCAIAASQI